MDRGQAVLILNRLLHLIRERGLLLELEPLSDFVPPHDIPPTHRDYQAISALLSLGLISLDADNQFHPQRPVSPDEMINALKRIEMTIQFNEDSADRP
jgi:hypothetical protein